MNIEDNTGGNGINLKDVDTEIEKGTLIEDENGNKLTVEDLSKFTFFVMESPEDLQEILSALSGLDGVEEIIEAIQTLTESLENNDFDIENLKFFTFDISLDYGGNNIIDLGDGRVKVTLSVPEEILEEGMKFLFFGIHKNADGIYEFVLISEDLIIDEDGNFTVYLSKFSNYFLIAAPESDNIRKQSVGSTDATTGGLITTSTPPVTNNTNGGVTPPPPAPNNNGGVPLVAPEGGITPPPPAQDNFVQDDTVDPTPPRVQQVTPEKPNNGQQHNEEKHGGQNNESTLPPPTPENLSNSEEKEKKKKNNTVPIAVSAAAGAGLIGGGSAFTIRRIRLKKIK